MPRTRASVIPRRLQWLVCRQQKQPWNPRRPKLIGLAANHEIMAIAADVDRSLAATNLSQADSTRFLAAANLSQEAANQSLATRSQADAGHYLSALFDALTTAATQDSGGAAWGEGEG
jgi:hypothetical protein